MRQASTLSDALSDYYAQRSAKYQESTWKAHEAQLEKFRTWATRQHGPNCHLADIDDREMVRYFNRLRPPAYEASTFNNYRQYLLMFWTYCRGEAWVQTNPMRHVDPARVPRKVRLHLSPEELLAMLTDATPRDRIALATGMNTALRANDVMALTVGSVNLSNDELTAFIQKTQVEEVLPITSELRVELIRWFQHYAEASGVARWQDLPLDWTLIPPARFEGVNVHRPELGGRIVYKTNGRYSHPEKIVHSALERMGYPTKREGFHTLRRSAARAVFDLAAKDGVGDPIRIPQSLLGHKNRVTTEIYLGITHEKRLRDDMLRGQSFLNRAVESHRQERATAEQKIDNHIDEKRRSA